MKKVVIIVGVLLILLLLVHQGAGFVFRGDYEDRLEGMPRLEDFRPDPIPDAENVAAAVRDIKKWYDKLEQPYLDDSSIYGLDDAVDTWDEEDWAKARKFVQEVALPVCDRLEHALERPRFQPIFQGEGTGTFVISVVHFSGVVRAATYLPKVTGKTEDLLRVAKLVLRIGKRCRMPFLIGHAVSDSFPQIAVAMIRDASGRPGFDPARVRKELDPLLAAAFSPTGPPADVLKQERAYILAIAEAWLAGESAISDGDDWQASWFARPLIYRDAARIFDVCEQGLALCDATPRQAVEIAKEFDGAKFRDTSQLSDGMRHSVRMHFVFYSRSAAALRLARTALAVLEQRDATGEWPAALPEPRLVDPFSGKPFVYEVGETRVRLYAAADEKPEELEANELSWSWPR